MWYWFSILRAFYFFHMHRWYSYRDRVMNPLFVKISIKIILLIKFWLENMGNYNTIWLSFFYGTFGKWVVDFIEFLGMIYQTSRDFQTKSIFRKITSLMFFTHNINNKYPYTILYKPRWYEPWNHEQARLSLPENLKE